MKLLNAEEVLAAIKSGKTVEYLISKQEGWKHLGPEVFTLDNILDVAYRFRVREMVTIGVVSFPSTRQ